MGLIEDTFPDFDEKAYLAANQDVSDAVARGSLQSGLAHFRRFGRHEQRPGSPGRCSYQPLEAVPPEALRVRVSAEPDPISFDLEGERFAMSYSIRRRSID